MVWFVVDHNHETGEFITTFEKAINMFIAAKPTERFPVSRGFYWRRGPGFILIEDLREWDNKKAARRIRLVDDNEIRFLELLDLPLHPGMLGGEGLRLLESFRAHDLVFEIGEWVVAIPYRKTVWRPQEPFNPQS